MDINEFLVEIYNDVRTAQSEPNSSEKFAESIFTEMVMAHMSEIGMSNEATVCHYEDTWGNAKLKLSGYAFSEDGDALDLFISHYVGANEITPLPDSIVKKLAEQCLRFIGKCAEGKLSGQVSSNLDVHDLILLLEDLYTKLEQVRLFVLTDCQTKSKRFAPREITGKTIQLEVLDIERLYNHLSAGKPKDEIVFNVVEKYGAAIPCIYIPNENEEYDYALTALPGEILKYLYERYGDRLLETNVRSFLSQRGKVNKGIRDTLLEEPTRFMAYNNGVVMVVDELSLEKTPDGSSGLAWLKGIQVVNGGQSTASLYFTKRKYKDTDLSKVKIAAKIIVVKNDDISEPLIADISKYANSQNVVRQADLSSNKPFHIEFEKLANTIFCPDGMSRWFYERSAGSYNVMLARNGVTPAKLSKLKKEVPTSRKITKTDLAKFLFAWEQMPHFVSLGGQKNFLAFMDYVEESQIEVDQSYFKESVAKTILFKETQKICRRAFEAFQGNIANYTISVLSRLAGSSFDLELIWKQQALSEELKVYLVQLSHVVKVQLEKSSGEKMLSEWAKKEQCWNDIKNTNFERPSPSIPEIKN
ncbi:AIPR family protein [Alteromonas sp. S167]|uniref:AIPR family protein n=1 Tax=Alteromonas sp. S167 TaxID=3117402 RepID=UPI002FE18562